MSNEHSVRDFRFPMESNSKDRLVRKYYRLAFKALDINAFKSKEAFLFTMRFFYRHPQNRERYDDVVEDTQLDLETEFLDEADNDNIQTIIKGLAWIYGQKPVLYQKIRSTFLELVTEKFVKSKWRMSTNMIHHEPKVMVRRSPFFTRNDLCNESKIDVVALKRSEKLMIFAECKANLNGFFGRLEAGYRNVEELALKDLSNFKRDRNKIMYLETFKERCKTLKISGTFKGLMTTFLDSRANFQFTHRSDERDIELYFAEDMAEDLFGQISS